MTIACRVFVVASLAITSAGSAQQPPYESQADDASAAPENAEQLIASAGILYEKDGEDVDHSNRPVDHVMQEAPLAYPGNDKESKASSDNEHVALEEAPGLPRSAAAVNQVTKDSVPSPETYPVKGVKSLITGSILLAIMLFATLTYMLTSNSESTEAHVVVARKVISVVASAEEFMEKNIPRLHLAPVAPALFMGGGPALILSGLVDLLASLKLRKKVKGNNTLWLRGLVLVIVASLVLGSLSFVPEGEEDDDYDAIRNLAQFAFEGVNIVGFLLLLTGFGKWLARATNQRGSLGKPVAPSLTNLQDTAYGLEQTADTNANRE